MSAASHQLDLVNRLGSIYYDELRELCRCLGVSHEGVTRVVSHETPWWRGDDGSFYINYSSSPDAGCKRYDYDRAPGGDPTTTPFCGKEFSSFVCEGALHVLRSPLRIR